MQQRIIFLALAVLLMACEARKTTTVKIIALDPGHFHASLVQQEMYPGIDSTLKVFAPEGVEVERYREAVLAYNERKDSPTHWRPEVYTGPDYLQQLLAQPAGNIVVIAGNNRLKSTYIRRSVHAGMHVLSDKPMAIDAAGFDSLKAAFEEAVQLHVQLYDIMTERYEITSILQRELVQMPAVFGELEKGTAAAPAVIKESVHHFKKNVAGKVLIRPAWYMDVTQQGEGIVDVTTHLVDLIQWTCFPDQVIRYEKDILVDSARRWPTAMTLPEFHEITNADRFPDYLQKDVDADSVLQVYANGAFDYQIKGVHARVAVSWKYQAPEGTGDTHYSLIRGTGADIVIREGALYIEPKTAGTAAIQQGIATLAATYPGIALKANGKAWEVVIPASYKKGHEASFARVMEKYLSYVNAGSMPAWEVPNMLAKYYTTTQALRLAKERQISLKY
ncbi:putative oxidoreductase C-terminal domain-containing protein [Chitinophaga sp.]|uniref:putative oxidoreductase C-terminal domain-containing protein n=1 Tax=Chitinophaga sp. TaxID=1869181 RepID=UPI002F953B02